MTRGPPPNILFDSSRKILTFIFISFQNFNPVPVGKSEFGKFYEGDSYVLLRTKNFKGNFQWDIHFWLGSQTSQDESGAAAILAVELDDSLGGAPIQHREVQDHESPLFLSYFPSGNYFLLSVIEIFILSILINEFIFMDL